VATIAGVEPIRLASRLTTAALVWSLGLLVVALLAPVYNGHTEAGSGGLTVTTVTFVQANGWWVLGPVALPAVACAVVAFALRVKSRGPSRRASMIAWFAVGLVAALALGSIVTIGVLILPVVALLGWAAAIVPGAGENPAHDESL